MDDDLRSFLEQEESSKGSGEEFAGERQANLFHRQVSYPSTV